MFRNLFWKYKKRKLNNDSITEFSQILIMMHSQHLDDFSFKIYHLRYNFIHNFNGIVAHILFITSILFK